MRARPATIKSTSAVSGIDNRRRECNGRTIRRFNVANGRQALCGRRESVPADEEIRSRPSANYSGSSTRNMAIAFGDEAPSTRGGFVSRERTEKKIDLLSRNLRRDSSSSKFKSREGT